MFPLAAEITNNDRRIEFDAHIDCIAIVQRFDLEDMQCQGELEL